MSKVDDNGAPATPTMGAPGLRAVALNGVTVMVDENAQAMHLVDGHGRVIQLPKGSHYNGNKGTVDLPGGDHLTFKNGQPIRNTPQFKTNKLTATKYDQNPYTGPDQKIVSGRDSTPKLEPVTYAGQSGGAVGPTVPKAQPAKPKSPKKTIVGAAETPTTPVPAPQPGGSSQSIAGGGNTHDFAVDVLKGLGLPTSASNIQAIMAWAQAESLPGKGAAFNPLNTTQPAAGATNFNSVGVKNFTSYEQGVAATIHTLQNGHYGPILQAFQQGTDAFAVGKAVAASPWGTGQGVLNVLNGGHVQNQPIAAGNSGGGYGPATGSGAGTAAGGSAPGGTGSAPTNGAGPLNLDTLAQQYGYAAAYLNGIPELRTLFQQAFSDPAGQWTPDKFAAKLRDTRYFKTHNAAQASWDQLNLTQHPLAQQKVKDLSTELARTAKQMGAVLSPLALHDLAVTLLSTGKDSDTDFINHALAQHLAYKGGSYSGGALTTQQQLEGLYRDYGLQVDPVRIQRAVSDITQGKTTLEDFTQEVKNLAKSQYPTLSDAIDRGTTVADYASQYRQVMSQILEIPPESVSLADPTIRKALASPDPKTGQPMVKPLWQFENDLRADPRWLHTDNARDQYMSTASTVLQQMGLAT